MALPLYVSLEQIDERLIEAAEDLYASRVQAFLRVTLPLSLPGVVAGTLLTFIPAAGDFINAELLGTPKQAMIGNVIQSKFLELDRLPGRGRALVHADGRDPSCVVAIYARALGTEKSLRPDEVRSPTPAHRLRDPRVRLPARCRSAS